MRPFNVAGSVNHSDHGLHRVHVRAFQHTRFQARSGIRRQGLSLGHSEQTVFASRQALLGIRGYQFESPHNHGRLAGNFGRHGAIAADARLCIGRNIQRCARIVEHGQALGVDQDTLGTQTHGAGSGVGLYAV